MIKRMDHVLVVDDDVELCSLVQEYLTAEGFSLNAVHDGEQGLQQALTNEYSLVVLDVMLPGINGFEVLRRIRSVSKIPVLLLTARVRMSTALWDSRSERTIIFQSRLTRGNWWRGSGRFCAAPSRRERRMRSRKCFRWAMWNWIQRRAVCRARGTRSI